MHVKHSRVRENIPLNPSRPPPPPPLSFHLPQPPSTLPPLSPSRRPHPHL
jgi:hypothetical protein